LENKIDLDYKRALITEFSDDILTIAFHLARLSLQNKNVPTQKEMKTYLLPKSPNGKLKVAALLILAFGCSVFVIKGNSLNPSYGSANPTDFETVSNPPIFSDPIDSNQMVKAVARFVADYTTDAGLNYAPVKIQINSALKRVFTLFPADSSSGMTFHYGLSDDEEELCYIIAPGTKLQSTGNVYYRPFPIGMHNQSSDHYILLKNSGGDTIQYITRSQFCRLTENYEVNMQRRSGKGYAPISSDPSHPKYLYHEGIELNMFIEAYAKGSPLYLYIGHGAIEPSGGGNFYHAACLLFGDDRNRFPLNNVDYPNAGLDTPYRSKAMDLGQNCPPYCGTLPSVSCP